MTSPFQMRKKNREVLGDAAADVLKVGRELRANFVTRQAPAVHASDTLKARHRQQDRDVNEAGHNFVVLLICSMTRHIRPVKAKRRTPSRVYEAQLPLLRPLLEGHGVLTGKTSVAVALLSTGLLNACASFTGPYGIGQAFERKVP